LREDLLQEVSTLAREGRFDYLLIESTGISEPLPVAETFTFADETGRSLSDVAQLDTMVTVVDALNFLNDYNARQSLKDRKMERDEVDERSLSELLTDQVEFADVILVNKVDLVDEEGLEIVLGHVRGLNPEAEIITCSQADVPLQKIMGTGKFDFEKAAQAPMWLKELNGEHVPETEEYGISHFVYRSRTPFHPERFFRVMKEKLPGVIRAKGFFWLASRMENALLYSRAGASSTVNQAGMWWAAVPKHQWPEDEDMVRGIAKRWEQPYGDRRQEIVFIGQDMDQEHIELMLKSALLTTEEIERGEDVWAEFPDPFPKLEALAEAE
jgi:G3E family GTPase